MRMELLKISESIPAKTKSVTIMIDEVTTETCRTRVITALASSFFPSARYRAMYLTEAARRARIPTVEVNVKMKLSMVYKPKSD